MATGFASGHQDTGAASGDGPNLPGLAESARMVATGAVSSRELVEDCLERIAVSQADLNAFRLVRAEAALAEADAADAAVASGSLPPLLGVPIAIKDDTDLAGETTPFGCGGELEPALNDAELVRRLRAAGAVIVGKTQAPEVGQWHFTESDAFGATRNPWSLGYTPGGSSGGAAAAVAAGLVPAAIGSDGAGSVRIPAAWNGLVGLKPQRGRISTWPEPEAFNGLTCIGPLTRSAADAALLLDALRGNVPADLHQPAPPAEPYAITAATAPRRLRIALSFSIPPGVADHLDDEVRERVEGFAAMLTGLGHEVVRADPPYGPVGAALIPRGMAGVEAWIEERGIDRAALEARTKVHARVGRALSGLPLRLARAAEAPLRAWIGRVFDDHDLVLTPATAKPPPAIGALAGRGYWASSSIAAGTCPYAFPWNVTGWPALSLPAGLTAAGLPVGAQLAAPEGEEGLLLALAGEVEAAVGGWPASPYARAL